MIGEIRGSINYSNKRRRLFQIRRAFEQSGYPVEQFSDSQIEAAMAGDGRSIEEVPISAKILSLAIRRLSKRSGGSKSRGNHSFGAPEKQGANAAAN